MDKAGRTRFHGITVLKRWAWTRQRQAEEAAAVRGLLKPMGDVRMKPLPGDEIDNDGRLVKKLRGP